MCPACFNLRLQETSLCSGSSWRTKAQEPMKSILPTRPGWKPTSHWGVPGDWSIPQKQNIPPSYLASFCDTIWHRRTLTRVSPAGEECFLLQAIGANRFPPCSQKPFWSACSGFVHGPSLTLKNHSGQRQLMYLLGWFDSYGPVFKDLHRNSLLTGLLSSYLLPSLLSSVQQPERFV